MEQLNKTKYQLKKDLPFAKAGSALTIKNNGGHIGSFGTQISVSTDYGVQSIFIPEDKIDDWVKTEQVCDKCDTFGGEKTFANQACMPIKGKVQCIDWCIHQIVAALNAGGIETVASCCGHGKLQGRIDLADGRILFIQKEG